MKFIESKVSYPFSAELTERILSPRRIIHLEQKDLDSLFEGKFGTMLEVQQTTEKNASFIQTCCDTAFQRKDITEASSILFYIEMSDSNPLLMEELEGLNVFWGKVEAEIKWCVSNIKGRSHRILIILM